MPINIYGNLDFPENPTNNDLFVDDNNVQWRFNGIDWAIFEPYYINDLSDVDISTTVPKIGDQLEWDGLNWIPVTELLELENLSDINLVGQTDGDFLVWSGTEWINTTFIPHNKSIITKSSFDLSIRDAAAHVVDFDTTEFTSDVNMIDLTNDRIIIQDEGLYYIAITYYYNNSGSAMPGFDEIRTYNSINSITERFYVGIRDRINADNHQRNRNTYRNLNSGDYVKFYYTKPLGTALYTYQNIRLTVLRISAKIL